MMSLQEIPTLNATLNGLSALLLVFGYAAIRSGHPRLHRRLMLSALAVSMLFLASYLSYHSQMGSVRFQGVGSIRTFYFAILITHSLLAAVTPFLALATAYLGLRGKLLKHRRLARWTLPIWLYVSVTGVAIYWMLYRI